MGKKLTFLIIGFILCAGFIFKIQPAAAAELNANATAISSVGQSAVAGAQSFAFVEYQLDATQASENIKVNSMTLDFKVISGSATGLTNCALYDGPLGADNLGTVQLNSGANIVDPGIAGSQTFKFDSSLIN